MLYFSGANNELKKQKVIQVLKLEQQNDSQEFILPLSKIHRQLKGYIVLHNTVLGPALGGTRIYPYKSQTIALKDALRLAKAMSYKCAISGLHFGGGKGVIIADPKSKDIRNVLKMYAEAVNTLRGKFYTGEDVGLTEEHVQYMLQFSPYFIGKSHQAGDPSPYAAKSAFLAGQVACKKLFKSLKLEGRTVAIKGVGKTGSALAKLYARHKATVFIEDTDALRVKLLTSTFPNILKASAPTETLDVDIYAPCALGNDITKKNIGKIKAKIIAGTANNQLESRDMALALMKKGILYVPDYIANSGGLINVAGELLPKGYNAKKVDETIAKVIKNLEKLLTLAEKQRVSPLEISNQLAEQLFQQAPHVTLKRQLIKV